MPSPLLTAGEALSLPEEERPRVYRVGELLVVRGGGGGIAGEGDWIVRGADGRLRAVPADQFAGTHTFIEF
jgi:hypothetical protein